jgi:hypothetical protein
MKYFLSTILLAILLMWGCEPSSDQVTGPSTTLDKSIESSWGITPDRGNYDLIPLPVRSPIFQDSIFSVSKLINGLLGGNIILNRTYISREGKLVTMLVNLVVPPLAFTGNRNITLTIDNSFANVHCEPGMTFNLPLLMVQTFTGLNLKQYNPQDIDFVYLKDDGGIEEINNSAIIVEKLTGTLTVLNAQVPHFSRYGWVRKHD